MGPDGVVACFVGIDFSLIYRMEEIVIKAASRPALCSFLTPLLSIFLTLASSISAASETKAREELKDLPIAIQDWYSYETDLLSRRVGQRVLSPLLNDQRDFYKPENKNVFQLEGVWLDENRLKVFKASHLSPRVQSRFERVQDGRKQFLFFIHPESRDLYKEILSEDAEKEFFLAAATSSSRSLLVWQPGRESEPFIAKVSLNKNIAGTNRSLKGQEVARSIGIYNTLAGSTTLPDNLLILPESLGLIPEGMPSGGMIVREFSEGFYEGSHRYIPLFALYAENNRGVLLERLQKNNINPRDYVREHILKPFVRLWFELAVEHFVLFEPHAQNVLIELKDELWTGRFLLRDFGGFNISFVERQKAGLFVPSDLPTFSNNLLRDYHILNHIPTINASLRIYFSEGFLSPLAYHLSSWATQGLVRSGPITLQDLESDLVDELSLAFSAHAGGAVQVQSDFKNLIDLVLTARKKSQDQCELILRSASLK